PGQEYTFSFRVKKGRLAARPDASFMMVKDEHSHSYLDYPSKRYYRYVNKRSNYFYDYWRWLIGHKLMLYDINSTHYRSLKDYYNVQYNEKGDAFVLPITFESSGEYDDYGAQEIQVVAYRIPLI